jgi:hypothetical protein
MATVALILAIAGLTLSAIAVVLGLRGRRRP